MIEFLNRLFGRQTSGATAKERLRLVLMSDHLSLAPEMIDAMKRDFVDVISRYVEVDRDKIDVHFEHQDQALAMLANIPITGVSRNPGNGSSGNGSSSNGNGTKAVEVNATPDAVAPKTPRRRKRRRATQQNGGMPQTGSPAPAT
jgi:cell division topological specificity factor